MTQTVEFLKLAALAVSLFGILGSGVCAIAYPLLRNRLLALDPATRAHILVAWSMAPCLIALALTGLCLLPLVLHFLGWSPTHCLDSHLCLSHPHQFLNDIMAWVAFALVGLLGLSATVTQLYRLLDARRVLKALALASRYDAHRGVQVVESDWPLALTAGLWRPRVFVSSRLTASLPADMLEVVIAHERAHTRQRDSLKQLVAGVFSLMHLPQVRRCLLAELTLACEQACDEEAAQRVGDRLRVAQTLLAVERLFNLAPSSQILAITAFASSNVIRRVEALLADPVARPYPTRRGYRWVAVGLIAAILAAEPLHRLTETLLGLLTA